jgi:proteasome lid subunit RPN8/RPN11
MSMPFRLQLPRRFEEEMIAQALAELPNECCGLLAGVLEAGVGRVTHRYPLVNAAASPREYLSQPESMFAAYKDMRLQELDLLAIYHSHPTSQAIPSSTDLERNFSSEVVHLIISLKNATPCIRGWQLGETDYQEVEWERLDESP